MSGYAMRNPELSYDEVRERLSQYARPRAEVLTKKCQNKACQVCWPPKDAPPRPVAALLRPK